MNFKLGLQVLYNLTQVESTKNNNSKQAPAFVVAIWPDEFPYNQEEKTGLNLKILTDGKFNIWKTSVEFGDKPGQYQISGNTDVLF